MLYSAVVKDKYDNNKVKFIKNQEYSRKSDFIRDLRSNGYAVNPLAVQEFYKDSRGYWLILNDDYILEDYYGAHVIHEDTINGTLAVLRQCLTKEC